MKTNKATFGKILERTGQKNSERLMAKARLANRIAKGSRGVNRRMAYSVKSTALYSLVKKLSCHVRVFKDIKSTDFVIVELKKERSGLHLLFARLAD
jgi:hypothetical protein